MAEHTPGPWHLALPGGPQGPFWGLVNSQGNVVALQIVNEVDARLCKAAPEMHALLLRADSMISLLRHRGTIRWGDPSLPEQHEVDQLIGELRRVYEGREL